jgi:DNA repair protein RecO (recombination protein O)
MPLKKAEAYVLRVYKFRENDRIIALFTHEYGKVRGIAKRIGGVKSRIAPSLAPLNLAEVVYFEKPGGELVKIDSVELKKSAYEIQKDVRVFYSCAYFCELIDELCQLGEPNPPVFRLIGAVLDSAGPQTIDKLARYFETWLLKLEGVFPDLARCGDCKKPFSSPGARYGLREGMLQCRLCAPAGGSEIDRETLEFLSGFLSSPPAAVAAAEVKKETLDDAERFLQSLLRRHLERELKTYRALKEL